MAKPFAQIPFIVAKTKENMNIELGQDFELDGSWWLPELPNDRRHGKLTSREGDGITLHLRGDFKRNDTRLQIIQGKTYDGNPCTLVQSYFVGPAISSMELDASHFFQATYLILGRNFDSDSAIIASSMSVSLSFLDEWLGFSPLSAGYPVHQISGDDWGDLQIFFDRPEKIVLAVPSINATVATDYTLDTGYGRYKSASQSFRPYLRIVPESPQHYSWYQEKIWFIERLLTLLGGKPVRAKQIRCDLNLHFSQWDFLISHRVKDESTIVHPSVLLIRRKEIQNNLEEIINLWLKIYERLDTVVDLFLGVSYNPKQYQTSNFLNLTQALEVYHRQLGTDKYLAIEEYDQVYETLLLCIPKGIPADLKTSLSSILKYGNEFSLRSRLKRIFKSLSDAEKNLVTDNSKDFIDKVVNTRNYYTHYDKSLAEKAAKGYEILEFNKRLSALIMLVLYKELNIAPDVSLSAIKKFLNPPYFYDPMSDD